MQTVPLEVMLSTVTPSQRTREDWKTLAEELLPAIQAEGGLTTEMKQEHGIGHDYRMKMALAEIGYDIHGNPLKIRPLKAKRPDAVAKEIVTRREKGEPYWLLEVETGMSPTRMQKLMEEHGLTDPATAHNGHTNGNS